MGAVLADYYLWLKAVHIFAIVAWMAGLFYLPRLYVYHTQVPVGSDQDQLFQVMEQRLLRIIMNPAMIAAWVLGGLLASIPGTISVGHWFWVKFPAVIAMTGFHMALAKWRKGFTRGENKHSEGFYRKANEIPTLLALIIIIMAVVKPL